MKIYKYQLPIKEKSTIELPLKSKILRVDDVEGLIHIWALVNPTKKLEKRYFEMYKTGQTLDEPTKDLIYIGFAKLFVGQELGLYIFERV